jgi:hypothetical protein
MGHRRPRGTACGDTLLTELIALEADWHFIPVNERRENPCDCLCRHLLLFPDDGILRIVRPVLVCRSHRNTALTVYRQVMKR